MEALKIIPNNAGYRKKPTGLTYHEAKKRLDIHGKNILQHRKKRSWIIILLSQFTDFMVLVLLGATALSMIMGEVTEAITILAIVLLNSLLGFYQEIHTEKTMEALARLAAPRAKVFRDGELSELPAELIVPGDLILLEAGDRIPADGYLTESNELQVDESLLTGESMPVMKKALPEGVVLSEEKRTQNKACVYMGCTVTGGTGKAVITGTGMNTEMGRIAHMIEQAQSQDTPLQKKLETLGSNIVIGCFIICAIVSIMGIIRGENVFSMLLAGISLAVAAVPEGLPAVVTIALALGVGRMVKRNALVRKLPAVETLGCATVICSDKTGTLTENKMRVVSVYSGRTRYQVIVDKQHHKGRITLQGKPVDPKKLTGLDLMMTTGILCSNVKLHKNEDDQPESGGQCDFFGDPTEVALVRMAAESGYDPEMTLSDFRRIREIPFDSDRKMMSVICESPLKEKIIYSKGAPEVLLKKCTHILVADAERVIMDYDFERILRENNRMGQGALRVIGMAYRVLSDEKDITGNPEYGLTFIGLAGIMDPPRPEAYDAVEQCKIAGIKPVMITGDHKETARAVAAELKIIEDGQNVITGDELENMNDNALRARLEDSFVFARVLPRHKLRLVKAYKEMGHIVAMTGDGVNDAPAVKEADIGVAMGCSGTDVTREAASMILMDDNFSTIVAAVEEGRNIYNNIRKFIRYLLSCNIGEVLTMFLGMLIGIPVPLLPVQILFVNLATDGLPAIALSMEPGDKNTMRQKPRDPKEHIFSGLWKLITVRGILIGVSTLLSFLTVYSMSGSVESARTATLVTLVLSQLIHVFECKSETKTIFEIPFLNNLWLIGAVLVSVCLLAGVVYLPFLQKLFKTVSLSAEHWMPVAGFSMLVPVVSSFLARLFKSFSSS